MPRLSITYRLGVPSIDEAAIALEAALDQPFYRQESPMQGPWLSSAPMSFSGVFDEEERLALLENLARPDRPPDLRVVLNEPEPGYLPPRFPEAGEVLLEVHADRVEQLEAIEAALGRAGIEWRAVARDP